MSSNGSLYQFVLLLLALGAILVNSSPLSGQQQQEHHHQHQQRLVGEKQCTWGPSYWCSDFGTAKQCGATRHCIQTAWERHRVQVDNDDICKICKDMVKQARDQLRSNETEEELKAVLEGSCKLIRIKPVVNACLKVADDFLPQLVEALSSEMDPDQVCSVAGLCNNVQIDEWLQIYAALEGTLKEPTAAETGSKLQLSCSTCKQFTGRYIAKLHNLSQDDVLKHLLALCDRLSTFSDVCSTKVLSNSQKIYGFLQHYLSAEGICHVSGVCASQYHQHSEDIAQTETDLAPFQDGDDVPCKLCEQLVLHLRDVLITNTTEDEFRQVLQGICEQTSEFKQECKSIVDQYYHVIYDTLTRNLNPNTACFFIGICPKGERIALEGPAMPLLPPYEIITTRSSLPRVQLSSGDSSFTKAQVDSMVLPIDILTSAALPNMAVKGNQKCTICEYALHFIQETLASPNEEEKIKLAVKHVCQRMPLGVGPDCGKFVDTYGDAVIALLIQGLNPVQICRQLQLCPAAEPQDKPSCPLCVLAVAEAKAKIGKDNSKKHIEQTLEHLCDSLKKNVRPECVDFVQTYTNELVDKLISDFSATEICADLRLCPKSKQSLRLLGISADNDDDDDSSSNEIADEDSNDIETAVGVFAPNCLLCKQVIKQLEKRYKKDLTKEEIKKILENACEEFKKSKTMEKRCYNYVEKYGDKIADLVLDETNPAIICTELGMCLGKEISTQTTTVATTTTTALAPKGDATPSCVICEFVMTKLQLNLRNSTDFAVVTRALDNICNELPDTISRNCNNFVAQFSRDIISLIKDLPPQKICTRLHLCFPQLGPVIKDDVVECGVCYAASQDLALYRKAHASRKMTNTQQYTNVACQNLPARYYTFCSEMMSVYGMAIWSLVKRVDSTEICKKIGKCYVDENALLAFAHLNRA